MTEDQIKNEKAWPANIKAKAEKEEAEKKKKEEEGDKDDESKDDGKGKEQDADKKQQNGDDKAQKQKDPKSKDPKSDDAEQDGKKEEEHEDAHAKGSEEHDWKRSNGQNKHHDAYGADQGVPKGEDKSEYEELLEKYSPQEIALLRVLQHEKDYIYHLKENDGTKKSPQTHNRSSITIDEQDQFSPDNWVPRSSHLIRLTGKHPLNGEPELTPLFEAGLITPNELHYVRNHGAVPHILYEFHKLDVNDGKLVLNMDDIKNDFTPINIAVALACDGNRRKELNQIKKSKGFSWGSGAVSCAYWKGPLLRDVLLKSGVPERLPTNKGQRWWVNFEGADEPSEGKYQTCIPFQYAMDPTNDVILAYEMNNMPLPPDHGYPLRLMIPGYVGGRCVKWLSRIWITDKENDSHYHIWDNRVLPSFVTEKDGAFAEAMFHHPDTACNEQNLQSVIVKPAQGEKISVSKAKKGATYRIEGYAYDGGGHEVQRVEVSLDGGKTWLYCVRKFPEDPIRHGNKFWTWVHWHVEVSMAHMLGAHEITVRCFNVFKNTQPEEPSWNTMGMMNNCWYKVKSEIVPSEEDGEAPFILFRHPCEPGTGDGGWMKPSTENQIASAKQEAGAPSKQFTREEIEKHDNAKDCWIVVDGKVYDATSVIDWHPGGAAAITGHAGKVHQETSDEFASIHDGYAYQKLKECILGVVSDKAMTFIKKQAEQAAKEKANSANTSPELALQKHRWVPVKLLKRENVSEDTRAYTFELPEGQPVLGLGTSQHVQLGFHMKDKMLIRSYTPTAPVLPAPQESKRNAKENGKSDGANSKTAKEADATNQGAYKNLKRDSKLIDGNGTFELTVKTYFPTDDQPGGAMSNILDCIPIGEEIEIRGPTGEITYLGNGKFDIEGEERTFKKVSLVLGGSGITPGYSLIARVCLSPDDETEIRVIDANKSEKDILLHEELDKFEKDSNGKLKITHVLSHPSDEWKGEKGHVNADIIKKALFDPSEDSAVFLCGPPAMIQKAALPALKGTLLCQIGNIFESLLLTACFSRLGLRGRREHVGFLSEIADAYPSIQPRR